jgi:tetratricopeptide (TPR) repeat protein
VVPATDLPRDGEDGDFSLAEPLQPPPPTGFPKVAGHEILAELGRGGMGVVYKARQTGLNRLVALKMLLAGGHAGPEQLARFHTEAQAVARLVHANIVQIYEVGEQEGLPYFSLELVDGGSLAQKIAKKPQPAEEAARLVECLAGAMAYAHRHGIIHRDLKPPNVLLTVDGIPKITDFGLAKHLEGDSSQTKSGTLMGTPSYMAPEQARGEVRELGALVDVYSLGAILYELLTGRPPFLAATVLDTLEQVRSQEPVPPSRFQPKVPRDLETICLKCLQKEARNRYASAETLTDDLRRFLAGEPILARPVSAPVRLWRWCRRNPRVATLSAAVVALLGAVGISFAIVAVRIGREREATAEARNVALQRLEQATAAIAAGNDRRAQEILRWDDPLLINTLALADVRSQLRDLQAQVALYTEFKKHLDNARYHGLFGARGILREAQQDCRQLLLLCDEIEQKTGKAGCGLPPLDTTQQQLFQEDRFEAYLVAAQVEWDLIADTKEATGEKEAVARKAITWLNRAEGVLPPCKVLYVRRAAFWEALGDRSAAQADAERAKSIQAQSAVDHYWHGFANRLRGDAAQRQGDLKQAQDHYRSAMAEYAALLRIRPHHFWGYFDWATCHYQLGNFRDAIVGFTTCIQIKPDVPWPFYNRGTAHQQLKEQQEAIQDFNSALDLDPRYAEAYCNRGFAYRSQGKAGQALEDLGRAIEVDPTYVLAHVQRGETYRQLKRFQEAVRDYDQAITLNPEQVDAHFGRAAIRFNQGHFAQARDDFSAVIRVQPRRAAVYRYRGFANLRLKDLDASLADWEELARLQPGNPEPCYFVGRIQMGRRQCGPALQALDKALKADANYVDAYLARAHLRQLAGKLSEALSDLNHVLEKLAPNNAGILNDRGDLHRTMGKLDAAFADYQRSVALQPRQTDAYIGLALVYEKQGQPDQVENCYERMVAADPESAAAHLRRAEFQRDRKQFAAALADCDQASRLAPDSVLPALVRASIHATHGDPSRAVTEAEGILQKAPANDGHVLYAAACVWSLASGAAAGSAPDEAKRHADRAAALLADGLDKGFHDLNYQEHNRMFDDPALAPLRSHARFRELLTYGP